MKQISLKKITRAQRLNSKFSENVYFYRCLKILEFKNSVSTPRYLVFTRVDLLVHQAHALAGPGKLVSSLPRPIFKG